MKISETVLICLPYWLQAPQAGLDFSRPTCLGNPRARIYFNKVKNIKFFHSEEFFILFHFNNHFSVMVMFKCKTLMKDYRIVLIILIILKLTDFHQDSVCTIAIFFYILFRKYPYFLEKIAKIPSLKSSAVSFSA